MKTMSKILLFLLLLTIFNTQAQERYFSYTTSTHITDKGKFGYQVWNTLRMQRTDFFRELDTRLKFEFGLGRNLEAAFLLNNSVTADQGSHNLLRHEPHISLSGELKLHLGSQDHHKYASALLEELTLSEDEYSVLTKFLLDRKTRSGYQALNLAHELVMFKHTNGFEPVSGIENKLEVVYGRAIHASKEINVGIEVREDNLINDHAKLESSTLFAGPAISYHKKGISCSLNVLPQIYSVAHNTVHHLNLTQHEKLETRFIISF